MVVGMECRKNQEACQLMGNFRACHNYMAFAHEHNCMLTISMKYIKKSIYSSDRSRAAAFVTLIPRAFAL